MKRILWQLMTVAMVNLAVAGLCLASESAKILRIGMFLRQFATGILAGKPGTTNPK